jgi:hypothetical protein
VKVPLTVAVVPDAVFVNEKLADDPVSFIPPLTWSSSASVSSIMISIFYLPYHSLHMREAIASQSQRWFKHFRRLVKFQFHYANFDGGERLRAV